MSVTICAKQLFSAILWCDSAIYRVICLHRNADKRTF